jgi:aspartate racemase
MGADFLAIPCNTAHYYYNQIDDAVSIPLLNMVELVVSHITSTHPDCRKTGVLGSTAIIQTQLYDTAFKGKQIDVIYPSDHYQTLLFNLIKKIKAGIPMEEIIPDYETIGQHLYNKGAETIIIACTELSAIPCELNLNTIDAAEVLADAVIKTAKAFGR